MEESVIDALSRMTAKQKPRPRRRKPIALTPEQEEAAWIAYYDEAAATWRDPVNILANALFMNLLDRDGSRTREMLADDQRTITARLASDPNERSKALCRELQAKIESISTLL